MGILILSALLVALLGRFRRGSLAGGSAPLDVGLENILPLPTSSLLSQLPALAAVPVFTIMDPHLSGTMGQDKVSFVSIVLVIVIYQNDRKLEVNIPWESSSKCILLSFPQPLK